MRVPAATPTGRTGRAQPGASHTGIVVVWLALAMGLPAVVVALAPLSTVDLAYGIRTGELILSGAGIPRADTTTFTAAGHPWVDQHWLANVIFGASCGIGGWSALQVLWVGVVAATVGLAARAAFVAGAGIRTSVVVALAGFVVAAQGFGLRAQALGLLCLAIVLVLVASRRDKPGLPWLSVPLLAVWANLHGSFVVGMARSPRQPWATTEAARPCGATSSCSLERRSRRSPSRTGSMPGDTSSLLTRTRRSPPSSPNDSTPTRSSRPGPSSMRRSSRREL